MNDMIIKDNNILASGDYGADYFKPPKNYNETPPWFLMNIMEIPTTFNIRFRRW
jgi:hypothetical protein